MDVTLLDVTWDKILKGFEKSKVDSLLDELFISGAPFRLAPGVNTWGAATAYTTYYTGTIGTATAWTTV